MKIFVFTLMVMASCACASVGKSETRIPASDENLGNVSFGNKQLVITEPLAKTLYFSLDKKTEIVSYTADCRVDVPGCASRVGIHLYCSNGEVGASSLEYKCYVDFSNLSRGEFSAHSPMR
jgi:hypothetical protein